MTPQQVLRKAADLIRERGHTQGTSERDDALCTLGALDRATAIPEAYEAAVKRIKRHLGISADRDEAEFRSLTAWNDTPGRTGDEVVEALLGAAEAAS